ncbi:MAG: UDP-N-acetylmuramoyl-tripeptide--D-alanyl-D-alanine ligase [Paludibacteraceae bacterium]|nr:UDP-N-acetylmuramoyl-tripeptide--D-alanyl-D-alanine ligase [Paludibacteraceae bacterium]
MDWNFLIKNKSSLTVTTDSRKVTPGCIFVALKGERFDGNQFVEQAIADGAAYVIKGEHALQDLQDLARAWRRELGLPIIGITGTNGKTTTKELTAAVLKTKYNLFYTQGNYNNALGVPLTLLSITRAHELAIVEMGASHPGDIKELVDIAEPNYGLITNVGKAHLEGFGSFEGVQRTKRELYDYLVAHQGTIFINEDNDYLKQMLADSKENYSKLSPSGATSLNSKLSTLNYRRLPMPDGTHLVGAYNAENVSAAMAVGAHFGVGEQQALEAIRAYEPNNHRSQLVQTEHNTLVVDAYNANPTSMQAAIEAFSTTPYTLRSTLYTYILGAMRELGEYSHLEHQNVVNMLLERKADEVYLIGQEYKHTTAPYPVFDDVEVFMEYLKSHPIVNKTILLKGSHSTQLEKLLPVL